MTKKRRYNSNRSKGSIGSDLKDFGTAILGAGLLLFLWLVMIVVQVVIAFWYVITPVILCLIYVRFKTRTIVPLVPIPLTKTIETIEDIKTNQGIKKVKTIETYQEKQSPGIINALINRF